MLLFRVSQSLMWLLTGIAFHNEAESTENDCEDTLIWQMNVKGEPAVFNFIVYLVPVTLVESIII